MAQHLLDVNALIALGWSAHHHHDTMVAWFNRQAQAGWATCAFTQAGFVRVLSQPAVSGTASTVVELTRSLERNLAHPQHRLLALDFDFAEVLARCSGTNWACPSDRRRYLCDPGERVRRTRTRCLRAGHRVCRARVDQHRERSRPAAARFADR